MALHATADPDEIRGLLSTALTVDLLARTMFGAVLAGLDRPDAAPWAAHPHGRPTQLAVRSRPDASVAVAPACDDVTELGVALAALRPPITGLACLPDVLPELLALIGRPTTLRMDERLFRLDDLVPPVDVAGRARPATVDDLELLVGWYSAFILEAFGSARPDDDVRAEIQHGLRVSTCWLWSVDGDPVSLAARHPVVAGMARIGPVYTPPRHRAHGYGSAVTAAAAQQILTDRAVACLYTDLANPTSNKIYQALGFRPVMDRCAVRFD